MINEREKHQALEASYQLPWFHDEDTTHPIPIIIIDLAMPILDLKASNVHFAQYCELSEFMLRVWPVFCTPPILCDL